MRAVGGSFFGGTYYVMELVFILQFTTGAFANGSRDRRGVEHEVFHADNEAGELGVNVVVVKVIVEMNETGMLLCKGSVLDRYGIVGIGRDRRQVWTPFVIVVPLHSVGVAAHLKGERKKKTRVHIVS